MFLANLLMSILLIITILSIVSPTPMPVDILLEDVNVQVKKDETTAEMEGIMLSDTSIGNNRSFDLTFVIALKTSSIWSDIQKRSITVTGDSELTDIFNKSPEEMSDKELSMMKKICHDGLKCVAVDQLLVLETITKPMENGLMSVRTAIVKITKVISEFTTEYHEDQYQYEEVKESDDSSKINETITTIVNDNAELCRIYIDSDAIDTKTDVKKTKPEVKDTKHEVKDTKPDAEDTKTDVPQGITLVNNGVLNLGTINHYSVNNGTTNSANINTKSSDASTQTPEEEFVVVLGLDNDKDCSCGKDAHKTSTPSVDRERSVTTKNNNNEQIINNSRDKNKIVKNIVNGKDGGPGAENKKSIENKTDVNIAAAGTRNNNKVHKGYVEDGVHNNGKMNIETTNNGTFNKGDIKKNNAKNGIINVGTINNGDSNYGTVNNNKDLTKEMDNGNIEKYVSELNEVYSGILERMMKQM